MARRNRSQLGDDIGTIQNETREGYNTHDRIGSTLQNISDSSLIWDDIGTGAGKVAAGDDTRLGTIQQINSNGSSTRIASTLSNNTLTVINIAELRQALLAGVSASRYTVLGRNTAGDGGGGEFIGTSAGALVDDDGVTFVGGSLAAIRVDAEKVTDVPAEWFGVPVTHTSLVRAACYANQLPSNAFDPAPPWTGGMRSYVTSRRLRFVSIIGTTDPLNTIHLWYPIAGFKGRSQNSAVFDSGAVLRFADLCGPAIVYHTGNDPVLYQDGYHYVVAKATFRGLKICRVGAQTPTSADVGVLVDGVHWFAGYDFEGCWITGHYHGIEFSSQYISGFINIGAFAGYCNFSGSIQGNSHWGIYAPTLSLDLSTIEATIIQNGDGAIHAGCSGGSIIRGDYEGAAAAGHILRATCAQIAGGYGESIHPSFVSVTLKDSAWSQVAPQTSGSALQYSVAVEDSHDCDTYDKSPVMIRGSVDCYSYSGWHVPQSSSEGLFSVAIDYTREDSRLQKLDSIPEVRTSVYVDGTYTDTIRVDGKFVSGKYLGNGTSPTVITIPHTSSTGSVLLAFLLQRTDYVDTMRVKVEAYENSVWISYGEKDFETRNLAQFVFLFKPSLTCTQVRLTVSPYLENVPSGATISGIVHANTIVGQHGLECFRIGPLLDDTLADWRLAQRQILRYSPDVLWVPPREVGVTHTLSGSNVSTLIDLSGNSVTGTVLNGQAVTLIGETPVVALSSVASTSITDSLSYAGGTAYTRILAFRDRSAIGGEAAWRVSGVDPTQLGMDIYASGGAGSANIYGSSTSWRIFTAPGASNELGLVTMVYDGSLAAGDRLRIYRGVAGYGGAIGGTIPATLNAFTGNTIGGSSNLDLAFRADFIGSALIGLPLWDIISVAARICILPV